jgi:hypothetical protein
MHARRFANLSPRIAALPTDARGFPVPWFVAWIDGEPDFRVIGPGKIRQAVRKRLCWICGQRLLNVKAFVVGPMCVINRISSEPPSHLDCARFAATACPFLTRPGMRRNEKDLPPARIDPAGIHITRNPGACAVYIAAWFTPMQLDPMSAQMLFSMGEPRRVEWFCEGREASRDQVERAIYEGLPALVKACAQDDDVEASLAELARCVERTRDLIPA